MSNDGNSTTAAPTRRDYVKYGGAVVGGGLLAGCSSGDDSGPTPTETMETATEAETDSTTETGTSYEVCIEPTGCITFEEVPKTWMAIWGSWADMGIALGQRDGFKPAGWYPPSYFFERVGSSMPTDVRTINPDFHYDKEVFYDLDPDVILLDPGFMSFGDDSWDEADTQEVADNVAPFFGCTLLRQYDYLTYDIPPLYEAFDRLADVFQERERYEAFATVHEKMLADVQSRLPPSSERPTIGLVNGGSDPVNGKFYAMTTDAAGVEMKPYHDLDVRSDFTQVQTESTVDYETLLDVDPEIIIVHSGVGNTGDDGEFSAKGFQKEFITPMENHSIGSQLTAVREGNVYPGAYFMQGPIVNLFNTELTARILYPEEFGAFDLETWPDVPEDEQLFDRQRVADIINGDL